MPEETNKCSYCGKEITREGKTEDYFHYMKHETTKKCLCSKCALGVYFAMTKMIIGSLHSHPAPLEEEGKNE